MPAPLPEKATHQQTKAFNSQLVLKAIYDHGQISRAALARMTSLTRATVSELVDELLDQDLVQEIGRGPSAGGKSPILLGVVDDARHIIAIDLASEVFTGAIMDLRGRVCYRIDKESIDKKGIHPVKRKAENLARHSNRTDKTIGFKMDRQSIHALPCLRITPLRMKWINSFVWFNPKG